MPGSPQARFAIDGQQRNFILDLEGREGNAVVWYNSTTFDLREAHFYEDGIKIDSRFRGAGHAQRIVGNIADLAVELEVTRIELHTEDVGGYMWARAGAVPMGETAFLRDDMRRRLDRLMVRRAIVPARHQEVVRLIDAVRLDPKAMWAIANLKDDVESSHVRDLNGDRRWALGKELLTGSRWHGVIRLDDPLARAVFEAWRSK